LCDEVSGRQTKSEARGVRAARDKEGSSSNIATQANESPLDRFEEPTNEPTSVESVVSTLSLYQALSRQARIV
jgi:hypothetical protein